MFDWHSTKDHSVIPSTYVELDPLIFGGTPKGSTPSGGTPRAGGWLPELTNPNTGAVGSEFGSKEDKWWGCVGPGEAAPFFKKRMQHH